MSFGSLPEWLMFGGVVAGVLLTVGAMRKTLETHGKILDGHEGRLRTVESAAAVHASEIAGLSAGLRHHLEAR